MRIPGLIAIAAIACCACGQASPIQPASPSNRQMNDTASESGSPIGEDTASASEARAGIETASTGESAAATTNPELKKSCQALLLDETIHRRWLCDADPALCDPVLASVTVEQLVRQETDEGSNASLGLRVLPQVLSEPLDTVTIWTTGIASDRPTPGSRGCWAIVRTGVRGVSASEDQSEKRPIVKYDYAVAYHPDDGSVSTMAIPVWFDGIDAHNMLTIQDLDGDGFEEAVYIAADGWEGEEHDSTSGGGTTFMLTAEGGSLRFRPPFERNSPSASWNWQLIDVNADRRLDMELQDGFSMSHPCPARAEFIHDVGSLFFLALIQSENGEFTFNHPDAHRHALSQCADRSEPITSLRQVLCARVSGDCTSTIRREIRKHNAPWNCRLDDSGAEQTNARANREFNAMMAAAAWKPPFSIKPLCNR